MSIFDSCIFIKHVEDEVCIIVVWVDDFLIASNRDRLVKELLSNLAKNYKFKLFGEPSLFLGVKLLRDRSKKTLQISQTDYLVDVLKKFGLEKCNPISTQKPIEFFLLRN